MYYLYSQEILYSYYRDMAISQKFLPSEVIVGGKSFYNHNGKELEATETRLNEYMQWFQLKLQQQGISFTSEELRSIQTASTLIDALAKTRFKRVYADNPSISVLESGHHVFNVFYKAVDSDIWTLQFANSSYMEKIGANLPDKLWMSMTNLMEEIYKPETIEGFTAAARNPKGWYTAQFIEMDKVVVHDEEDIPAFFWYRKEFNHPDGGKIQIRIGMNGTGLSLEQRTELADAYKLADILRTQDIDLVHYSNPSYESLINRIKNELEVVLGDERGNKKQLILPLDWMRMILQIADDIVKNSPFPFTIVDENNIIEQVSPAYAAMVGYRVRDILEPGFFDKIYPGIEGNLVKQSIAKYVEQGYYPEDASFIVSRGSAFRSLEEQHHLHSLKSLELIPSPFPVKKMIDGMVVNEGTVRLNTARPLEKSLLDLVSATWKNNCYFETEEPCGTSDMRGDLDEWLQKNS